MCVPATASLGWHPGKRSDSSWAGCFCPVFLFFFLVSRFPVPGPPHAMPRAWSLETEAWSLETEAWSSGLWTVDSGLWTLESSDATHLRRQGVPMPRSRCRGVDAKEFLLRVERESDTNERPGRKIWRVTPELRSSELRTSGYRQLPPWSRCSSPVTNLFY